MHKRTKGWEIWGFAKTKDLKIQGGNITAARNLVIMSYILNDLPQVAFTKLYDEQNFDANFCRR